MCIIYQIKFSFNYYKLWAKCESSLFFLLVIWNCCRVEWSGSFPHYFGASKFCFWQDWQQYHEIFDQHRCGMNNMKLRGLSIRYTENPPLLGRWQLWQCKKPYQINWFSCFISLLNYLTFINTTCDFSTLWFSDCIFFSELKFWLFLWWSGWTTPTLL